MMAHKGNLAVAVAVVVAASPVSCAHKARGPLGTCRTGPVGQVVGEASDTDGRPGFVPLLDVRSHSRNHSRSDIRYGQRILIEKQHGF
ncbi:hypothetical protein BC939DRAFT_462037 [Gamsiella multidivaricata]|uniref:uncharacterized protein n=1 Tax=Gamsiella multidivaricata TaxID=101098 RepID=UPI0022209A54|nr:uncharacterized protein BC939DRAFT_462037 [Gamsiella multidivaricata]KAI7818800.1 hypothetical protein BC939DRAFT_462037 [Gamsiella multidivaricata]